MKRCHWLVLFALCTGVRTQAVPSTPLNAPLVEQQETLIACELSQAARREELPALFPAPTGEDLLGAYHYHLWLPEGYKADDQKAWPCIFIAAFDGEAVMGNMATWLKANGYIVVMLVESKNGAWAPIIGNFLAAHDDAIKRLRIQEGLKLATGLSGGARASSQFVQLRSGFAGLILQGAGSAQYAAGLYHVAHLRNNPHLVVAMTMGEQDSNKGEVLRLQTALGSTRFMAFPFDGGHVWAPQVTFDKAITWVEQQIYHQSGTALAVKKLLHARYETASGN